MIRSYLFVPGDSRRKFEKARAGAADALILDLEDSVAAEAKPAARACVRDCLSMPRARPRLFVRVNAFDTGLVLEDLAAVMACAPDGIVLPKCEDAAQVTRLSHILDGVEVGLGQTIGRTAIVAIVTETPAALFSLGHYRGASPRLSGMMWGAEDLSAELGAYTNAEEGAYTPPFELARALCLAGAAAAGVPAIDAICADISNLDRVAAEARLACRDGFEAKAVIHPAHVEPVNAAFTPHDAQITYARRVLDAMELAPRSGVVQLDGRMIDRPHQRLAQRILQRAVLGNAAHETEESA
ncbi:HpcH/HpaI aldolase/citrate lyase family protein [Paracoccus pantotrophus]|uniref:HpcH/HpaI aldolase/citrate lyase family protein n=1 Tax=Paracoccus pantotrophus TaxID=82367 RepID=UPI0004B230DF|nr:CoA ester lyase [Paracoccus pantotrophus]